MTRNRPWLDLPIEEARRLAATPTDKPETGEWRLVSPSGRVFSGENPMECLKAESRARIPAEVALARIRVGMEDDK